MNGGRFLLAVAAWACPMSAASGNRQEGRHFQIEPLALQMRWIEPGSLALGSPDDESSRGADEGPVTSVALRRGYWIGRTEVTQRQWYLVMDTRPSRFSGPELPVEQVSWHDAMVFASRVSELERAKGLLPAGYAYSLPTEAQWEFAAKAGEMGAFAKAVDDLAWHDQNSDGRTWPVATLRPNAFGLHDMLGNVWEWCLDWYAPYPGGEAADYAGPASGTARTSRGGSWWAGPRGARPANRYRDAASNRNDDLGFRLALVRAIPPVPQPITSPASGSSPVSRPIALAGTDTMAPLVRHWASLHEGRVPGSAVSVKGGAPPSAADALAAATADVGFTGRALRPEEIATIVASRGVGPRSFRIGTGAHDDRAKTHSMAVFVHPDNPLRRITFAQLRAAMTGADVERRWAALGSVPPWDARPIVPMVAKLGTGATDFVRQTVLAGQRWAADVREFETDAAAIEALAANPFGLVVAGFPFGTARVRALAVADTPASGYFEPLRDHVASGRYPLARPLFLHCVPSAVELSTQACAAFIATALSVEGQVAVNEAGYVALPEWLRRESYDASRSVRAAGGPE